MIAVARDGEFLGTIAVSDTVKPTSAEAIARFRALGLSPVLLTGDNAGAAQHIAAQVGIDEIRAGVTPAGKLEVIRQLQAAGRVVAMVGDGVNDAAALAAADLGVAMGGGTDAAIAASDVTIASGDLLVVVDAIRLSRRTLGTIKGNLFWAFAYNIAAIPIAMLGLLNPLVAAAAMALSSVFVVTNSLRLRSFRPTPHPLLRRPRRPTGRCSRPEPVYPGHEGGDMSMIALAQRLRPGPRGLGRSVLLLIAVTAAIIVGLLAMHSLNSHTETAAPAAAAPMHEHGTANPGVVDHGTTQPATDGDCADCGGHASMLAMACVLALLIVSLLLFLPRVGISWGAALRAGRP